MTKISMEGDDGVRPERAVLISARMVDGRVRIVLERVKHTPDHRWVPWSPVAVRELANWDAALDDDVVSGLGSMIVAELEAASSEL
ncbi:MAG: hypothetical protein U0235_26895 [Polyangiaceae bacterium]